MKKRVLITGLSSALMLKFLELVDTSAYDVTGISRQKQPTGQSCTWVRSSLEDFLSKKDSLHGFDIIIHAAGVTHCWTEEEYINFNYLCTKKLVDVALDSNVKQIVYVSTRAVGMNAGAYGKSKFLAEEYIKDNFKNWLIFRPAEVFGGLKNEGIEKTIADAFRKKFVIFPMGGAPMAPVSLSDTVNEMYKSWSEGYQQATITINGPEEIHFHELLQKVERVKGSRLLKIGIPKWIMEALSIIVGVTKVDIGMVPDQVKRFYVAKGFNQNSQNLESIDEYISKLGSSLKI